MPRPEDDDRTIRVLKPTSPVRKPARAPIWVIPAAVSFLAVAAMGFWFLWPSPAPVGDPDSRSVRPPVTQSALVSPPPTAIEAPPVAARAPAAPEPAAPRAAPWPRDFQIVTADEQRIRDHVPAETAPSLSIFRFSANPKILVLDFASLRDQGRMLNRAAAFVEKTGLPHDRLLTDTELDQAVRASGDTVETFYYGHDYGVPSLLRFFALAERDKIQLLEEEHALNRLLRQEGWFEPNAQAGLISIPQAGSDAHVTPHARATILHHELSHGEYFTNAIYAAFVHRFWTQTLTSQERDRIRRFLHTLGYEPGLEHVMENEAQAYLMFTENAAFFTPDMIGMTKGRLVELRTGFYRTMPAGWLRDDLGRAIGANKTVTQRP